MADFLTRLAGRTLGLAPTVQPVIAPLYAPAQQPVTPAYTQEMPLCGQETIEMDGADSGHRNGQAAYSHVEPFQRVQPQPGSMPPPLVSPVVAPVDQPSLPHQAALHTVPDVQPAPATQFEESKVDARRIAPEKPQSGPSPGQTLRPTRRDYSITSDIPESVSSPGQVPRFVLWMQSSAPLPPRAPSPSSSLLPASRGEYQSKELSLEEAFPGVDTITSETPSSSLYTQKSDNSIVTAVRVSSPRYQSRAEQLAMGQREETAESSLSTPIIQVTIGRIEVRATPPTTTHPQRQRSGPLVMGLEEYLAQRAKGGY